MPADDLMYVGQMLDMARQVPGKGLLDAGNAPHGAAPLLFEQAIGLIDLSAPTSRCSR